MIKRIYEYFSDPKKLSFLNGLLIALMLGLNSYFPAFCIPTTWATILLSVCFVNTVFYPLTENTFLFPLSSFLSGVSLFVFVYCVIFLGHMNVVGLVLILLGIGLFVFIPHFFIAQILWKNVIRPANKASKKYFISAVIICFAIVFLIGLQYHRAIASVEKFKQSGFTTLDKTFMTEKILGMHLIYHTRYNEYDGWRPPKHEPILVIGMWLNLRCDPLNVDLEKRLELYRKFFPDKQVKFDCSCSIQYSSVYHNDTFWK